MLTPRLCLTARAALSWTADRLAEQSGVSKPTILRFENERTALLQASEEALVLTFTRFGIEFTEDAERRGITYPKRYDDEYFQEAALRLKRRLEVLAGARAKTKARREAAKAAPASAAPPASAPRLQGEECATQSYEISQPVLPVTGDAWDFLDDGK
jgi:transcriptional regulator with XRE-family HTH domain